MARFIQGLVQKHNLMKQPMVVINKGGGAGAEGFLDVKGAKGDPYKLIITLSNLFTTPMATGVPFNWQDLTPVAMMALDEFVLWVNAETPYKTAKDYVEAAKKAGPGKFKMGGTGSKQEDQIITVAIERQSGAKFTYIPYKGGGEVATQLVGKHVDSTVNNPIEAVAQWRAGTLRPLCVFDDKRLSYKTKVTDTMAWSDIPTCKESGLEIEYLMLRGIFMAGGVTDAQRNYLRRPDEARARAARMAGIHGARRLQPDRADRRRLPRLGGAGREASPQPDEGSRVPRTRQVTVAARPGEAGGREQTGRVPATSRRAVHDGQLAGESRCAARPSAAARRAASI